MDPITLALAKKYTDKKIKDSSGAAVSWDELEGKPFGEEETERNILDETTVQVNTSLDVSWNLSAYSAFDPLFVEYDGVSYECGVAYGGSLIGSGINNTFAIGDKNTITDDSLLGIYGNDVEEVYEFDFGNVPFILFEGNRAIV